MKKAVKIIIIAALAVLVLWAAVFCVDYARVKTLREPIFAYHTELDEYGSGIYKGIGYSARMYKEVDAYGNLYYDSADMFLFRRGILNYRSNVGREQQLRGLGMGSGWKIASESDMIDYMISGIYSEDGKSGIAVFKRSENGKYKLESATLREKDEIVISGVAIDGKWYDIAWFNGAETQYMEAVYTVDGELFSEAKMGTDDAAIFVNEAPPQDYELKVAYFDKKGNKYE